MSNHRIIAINRDAQIAGMYADIAQEGLRKSVQRRLDEIDEEVKSLPYLDHRYIQCLLCEVLDLIDVAKDNNVPVSDWISVKDRLPEMHKSIFAPWYGRKEWTKAMWQEESDRVIVAIKFPDGSAGVGTARLRDGKWSTDIVSRTLNPEITHWMPLPEPPEDT